MDTSETEIDIEGLILPAAEIKQEVEPSRNSDVYKTHLLIKGETTFEADPLVSIISSRSTEYVRKEVSTSELNIKEEVNSDETEPELKIKNEVDLDEALTTVPSNFVGEQSNLYDCQNTQTTQEIGDIIIETNNDQDTSNSRQIVRVRVDNKAAERSRLYRERHREEINQRRRDSRLKPNISRSIPATTAERNRLYRERHREEINQRRRDIRQNSHQIHTLFSSNSHTQGQRRYYERHKEEINMRKRDSRLKQNISRSIPATAAERNRNYRERNKQKINERRRLSRLLQQNVQRVHHRIDQATTPYQCAHCNFSSMLKSPLISHMRTHFGKTSYTCSECDFFCAYERRLKEHQKRHRIKEQNFIAVKDECPSSDNNDIVIKIGNESFFNNHNEIKIKVDGESFCNNDIKVCYVKAESNTSSPIEEKLSRP